LPIRADEHIERAEHEAPLRSASLVHDTSPRRPDARATQRLHVFEPTPGSATPDMIDPYRLLVSQKPVDWRGNP
jgi:hypothetical protein